MQLVTCIAIQAQVMNQTAIYTNDLFMYGVAVFCLIIDETLTNDTFSEQSAKHVNWRDCLADLNASTWLLCEVIKNIIWYFQ